MISRLRELEAEELEQEDAMTGGHRSKSGCNKQIKSKATSKKDNTAINKE